MAKITFRNKSGDKLVGIIHRTAKKMNPERFIVFVHGFTGNRDEKGLFVEAENYFLKKNFSVFRFDMRGCGESEGNLLDSGLAEQKEDLLAAISFLENTERLNLENIYIVGFSLGATVSIIGYKDLSRVKALAFWSPAFFPNRDMFPRYHTEDILNDLIQKGFFIKSGIKVGKGLFEDLRDYNLVPYLEDIKTPTLVIHGNKDSKISIESSIIGVSLLNGFGNFKKILNADHSFRTPTRAKQNLFNITSKFFISIESSKYSSFIFKDTHLIGQTFKDN
jgi:pimeloyl-ACP methyl ester carboxylesterase